MGQKLQELSSEISIYFGFKIFFVKKAFTLLGPDKRTIELQTQSQYIGLTLNNPQIKINSNFKLFTIFGLVNS